MAGKIFKGSWWFGVGLVCLFAILGIVFVIMVATHPPQVPTSTTPPSTPVTLPDSYYQQSGKNYIKIKYPQNGDTLHVGDAITVTWISNIPAETSWRVNLSDEKLGKDYPLGLTKNTGTFPWMVTNEVINTKLSLELIPQDYSNGYIGNIVYITISSE
jgi:hypothetical protein